MPEDAAEDVRQRAEACQQVVEDYMDGKIQGFDLIRKLKQAGATTEEAREFLNQASARNLEREQAAAEAQKSTSAPSSRNSTPEGLAGDDLTTYRDRRSAARTKAAQELDAERIAAVDAVAWRLLEAKASQLTDASKPSGRGVDGRNLADLLGLTTVPGGLPSGVLSAAPFLAHLSSSLADPHLEATRKLRTAFGAEKAVDAIVDLVQLQPLTDPIPRSIWRKIIQDQYVDFEKLFASMDAHYNHDDEPKELPGGYALVKKDQLSARRVVHSEADWIRIFSAWESGVIMVYPHRVSELQVYRRAVMDLFRAAPSTPQVAIRFDVDVRDRYSKSFFRLDDRGQLNIPLMAQMFRPNSSSATSTKRSAPSGSTPAPSKRVTIPCENWNLGNCEEPCENRRKHGICSECGGQHKEREQEKCYTLLQARRAGGRGYGFREGVVGRGRT